MEIDSLYECPVIDSHIHYPHPAMMGSLMEVANKLKLERINIVCTPHQERLSLTPDALHLKAHHPGRVFIFGGLNVGAYLMAPDMVGEIFGEFIHTLVNAGCDGIKMIEGKPDLRKMLPIPKFDSEAFAPYWEAVEAAQIPVIFHVNDPEEFWEAERVPDWAVEQGWFYGDGSYIDNEAQYAEIYNVLARYPRLKIIFAHFFFLSAQLPRLSAILERYPNICVDLTPGIEMYHNFSMDIEAARDFFLKYQDRILFGTDIGAKALLVNPEEGIDYTDSYERVLLVRNTLENEGEFTLETESGFLFGKPGAPFQGLGLPKPVLEKIYSKNFERIVGPKPRLVNPGAVVEMCDQVAAMIQVQGAAQPGMPGDVSVAQAVRAYFEGM